FQLDSHFSFLWQINGIDLAGLRETERSWIDEFVMRFGLPPFEAGEELHHVRITPEHRLGVIATTVDPTAASVWPDVRTAAATLPPRGGRLPPWRFPRPSGEASPPNPTPGQAPSAGSDPRTRTLRWSGE